MKGIHTFTSQTEGLKYFVTLIINAANRGWFKSDDVKSLFRRELAGWGSGSAENIRRGPDASGTDHCIMQFWGLVCLPILSFFDGVARGGDNSMECDFGHSVEGSGKRGRSGPLVGHVFWYGQWTNGRFVRMLFGENGSCQLYYDTGYRKENYEDIPKGHSSFLNLPIEGDTDFSAMSREEFAKLAKNPS